VDFLVLVLLETLLELMDGMEEAPSLDVEVILEVLDGTLGLYIGLMHQRDADLPWAAPSPVSGSLLVRNGALKLLAALSTVSAQARRASLTKVLEWLGKETLAEEDAYSFALVLKVSGGKGRAEGETRVPNVGARVTGVGLCGSPGPDTRWRDRRDHGDHQQGDVPCRWAWIFAGSPSLPTNASQVFVDAYGRVPHSRRLRLFQGEAEYVVKALHGWKDVLLIHRLTHCSVGAVNGRDLPCPAGTALPDPSQAG
jgi:hypothetical protein